MYTADLIDIAINGSGILAEDFTLSSSNTLESIYSVGKRNIVSISPNGPLTNTFKFSFYPEIDNNPIHSGMNILRNLLTGDNMYSNHQLYSGVQIEFAGLTGFSCFPESYSVHIEPNLPVKGNASFISYLPLSGTVIRARAYNDNKRKKYNTTSGIAFGWSAFATNSSAALLSRAYGIDYEFNAQFEPTYQVGKTIPQQVNFMGADEKISFIRDDFVYIKHSGQFAWASGDCYSGVVVDSGTYDNLIDLYTMQFISPTNTDLRVMQFDISGAKVINTELSIRVDDYLRSTTTITNSF